MQSDNLINREMSKFHWDMAIAIKNSQNDCYTGFQEFWKKRCKNSEELDDFAIYEILSKYGADVFDKEDWYQLNQEIRYEMFWVGEISLRKMNELYLSTIQLMQMCYENKTK